MPMPEPRPNESHDEFDTRCMADEAMQAEYPDQTQRYAVCQSIWRDRNKEVNQRMLDMLAARTERKTLHGYGIRTAADYVRGAIGDEEMLISPMSFEIEGSATRQWDRSELLKEATSKLVYSNEETQADKDLITGNSDIEMQCKALKVDKPPRTLALFEAVLTTPRKDRDGDILRSEGAIIDPKMVTLWHHMMPMPVGILLAVTQHSSRRVKIVSTIIDKPLGLDTMHLLEHRALRMSHGFRPLRFEPLQGKSKDEPPGFDVKEFEVLEASVVTVPSNPETEAWITAYSRGKLHSPEAKHIAQRMHGERPVIVQGYTCEAGSNGKEVTLRILVDKTADNRMPGTIIEKVAPISPPEDEEQPKKDTTANTKHQDTRSAIDTKAVRAATTRAIQEAISGAKQGQR